MIAFLLEAAIVTLLIIHAGWLALFVLELLFDTHRETTAERWRILRKYLYFGLGNVAIIIALVITRWFQPDWLA